MVEVSKPPRDEAVDDVPSDQHPLGLFYLDEGRSQTVVEVIGGTEQDPKFHVLGQNQLYNFSDFPAKCRMLGPVVMPARRHEEVIRNPTQLAAEMIQSAYQSGFSAGAVGLKPELQAGVKYRLHDGLVHALMTAVASGARLRTRREEDVYEVVDKLVERVMEVGSKAWRDWDERKMAVDQLRDAAMYKIRDVVDKPNPNHPDDAKRTYGAEDHESWVHENEKLRSVVLWAAQQIPDKAKLRELGAKIRAASVQDKAEEDEIQILDFRKLVETVCDLVDAAVDCRIPEADLATYEGGSPKLPLYWNGKIENAASKLRQACCDLPDITTLARLRFA